MAFSKLALAGLAAAGAIAVQQPMQAATYVEIDDFAALGFASGDSIEGEDKFDYIMIDALHGDAVAIFGGESKNSGNWSYQSRKGTGSNGGLLGGGFSEVGTNKNARNNSFRFTFKDGYTASTFSLLMMDYGDYNPFKAKSYGAYLMAYDINGEKIEGVFDSLVYDHQAKEGEKAKYGDATDSRGLYGQTELSVQGEGIAYLDLTFDFLDKKGNSYDKSFDPFIGFDKVSFTAHESVPEPASILGLLAVGAIGTTVIKRNKAA